MVQSVELVMDEVLDAGIRAEWQLLLDADLPSQARHTGPSNAPHVTLGVAESIGVAAEDALARITLPGELRLGGLLVFRGRTAVLSRAVVPTAALLAAHAGVDAALAGSPGRPDTTLSGRWTPHVTLARRLDEGQLARAMAALRDRPRELVGGLRALRRWDSHAGRVWDVSGAP